MEYDVDGILKTLDFMTKDGNNTINKSPILTEEQSSDLIKAMYFLYCISKLEKSPSYIMLLPEIDAQKQLLRKMFGDIIFLKSRNHTVRFNVNKDVYTVVSDTEVGDEIKIEGTPFVRGIRTTGRPELALPRIMVVDV